jgi:ATP-binding cassette, subfamily B, bacterial PglK
MQQAGQSITMMARRLWWHAEERRRRQFVLLLGLTVIASLTEIISIGAVLPFLGALSAPDRVFNSGIGRHLVHLLGLTEPSQIILPLTIAFGGVSLVAGAMRILLLRASNGLCFGVGADISNEVYRRTLYQPYSVHIARNTSEIINGIAIKTNEVIFYIIMPTMLLLNGAFMVIAIIVALALFTPFAALAALGVFGTFYALLAKNLRRRLKANSEQIARESTNTIKYLQEGLGGIRDILIDGTQEVFCTTFRKSDAILRRAQSNNQFLAISPRFAMESAGIVLIAGIAFGLSRGPRGVAGTLPMLAALALGLQRLLPSLQQVYQSWSTIHGAQESLRDTLALLEQPMPAGDTAQCAVAPVALARVIELKNISFRYGAATPWVLDDVNIVITKGDKIGVVGATGSGKSTLLDIVMGLLSPSKGEFLVDGVSITERNVAEWRSHIAHVPQSIFLTDGSVRENIAFGVPAAQIDDAVVRESARRAQIAKEIESWAEGYDTVVGERGVQLSGGQRQRIGIARALYKKADLVIFDEATSALDTATEESVMDSIASLNSDITILMIAHRLSSLKNCTQIIEFRKPNVTQRQYTVA